MRITTDIPRPRVRRRTRGLSGVFQQGWLLLPILLVIVAIAFFWWLPSRFALTPTLITGTVTQGDLTVTASGSGSVAEVRQVELTFPADGTVSAVNVRVGDQVTTGQALATIDTADLQLALQQAQANLKSAEAKLTEVQGGSATATDLESAKATLENAKAQYTETQTSSATSLENAKAQLDLAQTKLQALLHPSEADVTSAQTQVTQAQTNLETQRTSLSQAKTSAYNQMQQAVNSLTQAQANYSIAKQNWEYVQSTGKDPSKTADGNSTTTSKLSDTQRQQYYNSYVQATASLQNAQNDVTQAQVAYDKARNNEAQQIPLLEEQVNKAQVQLNALMNPSAADITAARLSVTQAQSTLDNLQKGGTAANLASAEAQVVKSQASLDALTAPSSAADLASAEASLIQAQVKVKTAERNLERATLTAPFDGVVASVSIAPGTSVGSTVAAVTLIDRSKLHVDASLSESDITEVAIGQTVTLTFDALPDQVITGTVSTIAPVATTQQNVTSYQVQIDFDPGTVPVSTGMSATAEIQTLQVKDAVLVPSRAIQTQGTRKSVNVLRDGQIEVPVLVETGVTGDGKTVITGCLQTSSQCLQNGDTLVIPTTTTTTTTNNNRFRGPGGGGIGGGFGGVTRGFGR